VKDNRIANSQLARVGNNLVSVVNRAVDSNAPGFVANDALAVLTRGLRRVTVAVKDGGCDLVGHVNIPGPGF